MGGWKDRSFIQYKSSEIIIEMTPLQQTPPPSQQNNGSQHKDDEFEIGKLNQAC